MEQPTRYYAQGDHDGLCGCYAVLNAFRFLQAESGSLYLRDDDAAFFDEAVECLARIPGVDVRILKSNSALGGIDQFQIRDLCKVFAERIGIDVEIELIGTGQRMPFRRRYHSLFARGRIFAIIAALRDGSHWIATVPHQRDVYCLIDDGMTANACFGDSSGLKIASDAAVVLKRRDCYVITSGGAADTAEPGVKA